MRRPIAAIRSAALIVMVLLVTLAAPAGAQQFSGTLRGTVLDSTGGVLPGAEIAIVNRDQRDAHGARRQQRQLHRSPTEAGPLRITVTKDGFKTAAIDQVKVDVQQTRNVDMTLQVGQAAELVTVVGTGGDHRDDQLDDQSDDREQAPGRSAAQWPQSVLAGDARARRGAGPRVFPVHQRRPQRDQRSHD